MFKPVFHSSIHNVEQAELTFSNHSDFGILKIEYDVNELSLFLDGGISGLRDLIERLTVLYGDAVTTTTEDLYRVACDTVDGNHITDASLVPDDCGFLTLVMVEFSDGTQMVIGPEEQGGYTYSLYAACDYDQQPLMERFLSTDGDITIDTLADTIRRVVPGLKLKD